MARPVFHMWWYRYLRRNKGRRVYRNGRSSTVYRPGTDHVYSGNSSFDSVWNIGEQ